MKERAVGGFGLRAILFSVAAALVLGALGFAALSLRSCAADWKSSFAQKAETRLYEYGSSLNKDGKVLLASKNSGFVIPREFEKKLILGFVSTAKVEIACQASINYYVSAEDLREAACSWKGSKLTLRVARPRAMRPIIETSSIRRAILDRGLAFNEKAELDVMLSQLSDLVAGSGGAALDDATLELCRSSLQAMASQALSGLGRRIGSVAVEWIE